MAFLRRICQCNQMIRNCNLINHESNVNVNYARLLSSTAINYSNSGEGWLTKLLMVRKIEPTKDSHSRLLSDSEIVYELQFHDVKPNKDEEYLKVYERWINELQSKAQNTSLIGSWRVEIGDQDQFVHLWKYQEGFKKTSETHDLIRNDKTLQQIIKEQAPTLRMRQNQFMLPFSFWGHPEPQVHNSMYEMRSYVLKPGTMIEWGNNWARGITFRKSNAVAGFFSQIGQLYMVHHIWRYEDLLARKGIREDAWRKPGWDECVAYTVPLIREMRSRWMVPLPFSPIR